MGYVSKNTDFYSVISSCLVLISEQGTFHEKKKFILAVCRLCFIGKRTNFDIPTTTIKTDGSLTNIQIPENEAVQEPLPPTLNVENLHAFNVFFTVFKHCNSSEIRETLLNIFETMLGRFCDYKRLEPLEPFQNLFLEFQNMPLNLRQKVMKLLEDALAVNLDLPSNQLINLTEDECRTFVSLLGSRRPSNVLIVSGQLLVMLKV